MSMNRVCVIGGGPAGLTAAIRAAESGAKTVLLEREERVGKKLLLTGNGKCNFTNRSITPDCYHAEEDGFVMRALSSFGGEDTLSWFSSLGIEPLEKNGGCLYPRSEQAASVLNALREEADRVRVRILTACVISDVQKRNSGMFQIRTDREMIVCDRLILATGSKAGGGKAVSETGSGYAAKLGPHTLVPFLPALSGIACFEKEFFRSAQGVRTPCRITLLLEGRAEEVSEGELQLTSYGVSGIPVFQLSRTVSRALSLGRRAEVSLNFLPEIPDAHTFLRRRVSLRPFGTLERFGNGLISKNLWNAILCRSDLKPGKNPEELTEEQLSVLSRELTCARFRLIRVNGFEQAQTCTGGIDLQEVNPDTMESRLVPGLYFAGELLNADGICGGYNLQWCWTSGTIAGRSAAK